MTKQRGSISGKRFNPDDHSPDYSADIAPEATALLELQKFPSFPTVQELLDVKNPHPFVQLAEPLAPPSPTRGLLQELLGGRLDVLIHDAYANPSRYDGDTRSLLDLLGNDPKYIQKMTEDEQLMLNRAVIDFAAFKPKEKTAAKLPLKPKPTTPGEDSGRGPQVEEDGPGGTMSPYWWLG